MAKQRYLEEESVRVAKHKSFMEAEKLTHRKREMEVRRRPGDMDEPVTRRPSHPPFSLVKYVPTRCDA